MKTEFTVRQTHKGYNISIGVGKTFHARDLQEVIYGLEHYFQVGILNKPFNYLKHKNHSKECDCCPLCRE